MRADASKARHNTNNLIKRIVNTLDPNLQLTCNCNCSQQSLSYLQVLTLFQQLHDATTTIETLRREGSSLQDHLNEAEHHCNQEKGHYGILKMKWDILLEQDAQKKHAMQNPPRRRSNKHKHKQIYRFPNSGESRTYISTDEEDPHAMHWLPRESPPPVQHAICDAIPSVSPYTFSPAHANDGHCTSKASLGDSSTSV